MAMMLKMNVGLPSFCLREEGKISKVESVNFSLYIRNSVSTHRNKASLSTAQLLRHSLYNHRLDKASDTASLQKHVPHKVRGLLRWADAWLCRNAMPVGHEHRACYVFARSRLVDRSTSDLCLLVYTHITSSSCTDPPSALNCGSDGTTDNIHVPAI